MKVNFATDRQRFGLERRDDHHMDARPAHPVMRKWWDHMKDIMRANPDGCARR
jgi:L-rhamnose mutarotase